MVESGRRHWSAHLNNIVGAALAAQEPPPLRRAGQRGTTERLARRLPSQRLNRSTFVVRGFLAVVVVLGVVAAIAACLSFEAFSCQGFGLGSAGQRIPLRRGPLNIARSAAASSANSQILLEATDLHGTYDDIRTLFRIESLTLRKGQKLAVVGSNGCGKSTLLAALGGKQELRSGSVKIIDGSRVLMVEQNPKYDPDLTVQEAIYEHSASPQAAAARKLRQVTALGETGPELQAAMELMDSRGAWNWEEQAQVTMKELGLDRLKDRKMGMLSGGEERRVALACALVDVQDVELLILDEPTNHLSVEGCDWLQRTLKGLESLSLVLVTHDRYFLDEVCDEILEIDGMGESHTHPGSWLEFLTRRAERFQQKAARVNDAKVQLKRAQEWMNRGPQGRTTKAKALIAGYHETKSRAEAVIGSEDASAPDLGGSWVRSAKIKGGPRTTGSQNFGLVALRNATVRRDDGTPIFESVSFEFPRGSKLGIIGPNGAGKSTLLRSIAGEQVLQEGELFVGDGARIGFLSQEAASWPDPKQRVLSLVQEMAQETLVAEDTVFETSRDMSREQAAASLLKSVNFAESRWTTELGSLSGGEARRLQLLRVLSQRPNVLLLDEPTNDLDAVTVDALERMLQPWQGTVLVVSHDRSLLDGVCKGHVVFPKDGGPPRLWTGSYTEFKEFDQAQQQARDAALKSAAAAAGERPAPKRMSVGERKAVERKLRRAEQRIEELDAEMEDAKAKLDEFGSDPDKVMELYAAIEELEEQQVQAYEDWETWTSKLEA